ncbi:MAG: 16S rRNA (cytosine(1402)-N(4))-methyltransferase RsmH [candidate division WOR-3 bacterium]
MTVNKWQGAVANLITCEEKKIDSNFFHRPVMVREVIQYLAPKKGIFIDATVGGGGHAEAILAALEAGFLIGIDLDPEAISYSQRRLNRFNNFHLFNCNFTEMGEVIQEFRKTSICNNQQVMGILFDLGVSFHQIRSAQRGFSFELNGPLDMRFNSESPLKAYDIIRRSSLPEIETIIRQFGEEKFAKRIAKAIWQKRKELKTTTQLADLITQQLKRLPDAVKRKAMRRTFQALRMATNNELENLQKGLLTVLELLAPGGRIVVLAYHSLEDRIVKNTFREFARQGKIEILTKKPLRPTPTEIQQNPQAHSARLRAAVKI